MNKNDFINQEFEARVMVNEQQYNEIKNYFLNLDIKKEYITNVNEYFDLDDLFLTRNHIVLRTRLIDDNKRELTLKIREENCDLELNHILSNEDYDLFKKSGELPNSEIKNKLLQSNIDISKLKFIVELKTERIEIQFVDYLLVIDKNYYRNKIDFNIEVESSSRELALSKLLTVIKPFGIKYKNSYVSKSRRAIYDL